MQNLDTNKTGGNSPKKQDAANKSDNHVNKGGKPAGSASGGYNNHNNRNNQGNHFRKPDNNNQLNNARKPENKDKEQNQNQNANQNQNKPGNRKQDSFNKQAKPRGSRKDGKGFVKYNRKVMPGETMEDIGKDIARIEKELELEIEEISNVVL